MIFLERYLLRQSPRKLASIRPNDFLLEVHGFHPTVIFLSLPPCPLQVCLFCFWDVPWINLDHAHVGMRCCGAGWCCSPGTIRRACWIQLYGWFHKSNESDQMSSTTHIQGGLYNLDELQTHLFLTLILILIYIHTYMHIYMHEGMHACMHACIHTYIRTYIHTYSTYVHTSHYITLHYITLH